MHVVILGVSPFGAILWGFPTETREQSLARISGEVEWLDDAIGGLMASGVRRDEIAISYDFGREVCVYVRGHLDYQRLTGALRASSA